MKKCRMCDKYVSDDALFCAGCGGSDFESPAEGAWSGQNTYDFTPGEIKGKVKAWQVILITLGCLAIIAAGVFAVMYTLGTQGYTVGETADGVYTNAWAEMKFDFGDEWIDRTAEYASGYSSEEYIECGFIASDSTEMKTVAVEFQHIGDTFGYSMEEGMNDLLDGYSEELSAEVGMAVEISDYFNITIAGEEYLAAKIEIDGLYVEYDCLRFVDEYAVVITLCAETEKDILDALDSFGHYEAE